MTDQFTVIKETTQLILSSMSRNSTANSKYSLVSLFYKELEAAKYPYKHDLNNTLFMIRTILYFHKFLKIIPFFHISYFIKPANLNTHNIYKTKAHMKLLELYDKGIDEGDNKYDFLPSFIKYKSLRASSTTNNRDKLYCYLLDAIFNPPKENENIPQNNNRQFFCSTDNYAANRIIEPANRFSFLYDVAYKRKNYEAFKLILGKLSDQIKFLMAESFTPNKMSKSKTNSFNEDNSTYYAIEKYHTYNEIKFLKLYDEKKMVSEYNIQDTKQNMLKFLLFLQSKGIKFIKICFIDLDHKFKNHIVLAHIIPNFGESLRGFAYHETDYYFFPMQIKDAIESVKTLSLTHLKLKSIYDKNASLIKNSLIKKNNHNYHNHDKLSGVKYEDKEIKYSASDSRFLFRADATSINDLITNNCLKQFSFKKIMASKITSSSKDTNYNDIFINAVVNYIKQQPDIDISDIKEHYTIKYMLDKNILKHNSKIADILKGDIGKLLNTDDENIFRRTINNLNHQLMFTGKLGISTTSSTQHVIGYTDVTTEANPRRNIMVIRYRNNGYVPDHIKHVSETDYIEYYNVDKYNLFNDIRAAEYNIVDNIPIYDIPYIYEYDDKTKLYQLKKLVSMRSDYNYVKCHLEEISIGGELYQLLKNLQFLLVSKHLLKS